MDGQFFHIVALGASTPVGRDAWSSAAAVRAGISGFMQHPYMIDTAGEPMRVALAPWLDIDLMGIERIEALLYPAIDQALAVLYEKPDHRMRIGLLLGLPSPRPGLTVDFHANLIRSISQKYSDIFSSVKVFPNGHAAGLLALDAAIKKLNQGDFEACVIAGVDSYLEPETLEWLEECDQLHSAGPLNNAWGFIPGEAAAALALIRSDMVQRLSAVPLACVLGAGTGFEPNRIKTETVCTGEGLTQAFRAALQYLPDGVKITDVYCDMNGEPYRADEYGFTCLRTKEFFDSASDFVAPADCLGDLSAAGSLTHVSLAIIARLKGYANGNFAFTWASSETGERAAMVMSVGRST